MKEITIFQENIKPLIINDFEDDINLDDYVKDLSHLLESSNVTILKTSAISIILRPSKINSVIVKNIPEKDNNEIKENQTLQKQNEDIITDM